MRQLIAAIFGIVLTLAVASSALADTTLGGHGMNFCR